MHHPGAIRVAGTRERGCLKSAKLKSVTLSLPHEVEGGIRKSRGAVIMPAASGEGTLIPQLRVKPNYCAAACGVFGFFGRCGFGGAKGSSCAMTGLGSRLVNGGVIRLPALRVICTGIVVG